MSVYKVRIKRNGSRHPISVVDVEKCPSSACCERKKSKFNNPKNMKKTLSKLHKIGGAHLQNVTRQYARFNPKE